MKELETILLFHGARYPRMQPQDAVKLLYQNTFGGGHMIQDEASCLAYLRREYASVEKDCTVPLCEEIGGGFVRVNLAALEEEALDDLGSAFLESARRHRGSLENFLSKLEILKRMAHCDQLPFSPEALQVYLLDYERSGYPMVSHSEQYRTAYRPAYRVVLKSILSWSE